jgi:NAD+ synthase (glutamine-hydrolysing)
MTISSKEYGFIRIAAISPEMKPGDIDFNLMHILSSLEKAIESSCHIAVFPEMAITGYTIGDLLYQDIIHKETLKALLKIAEFTEENDITAVVGAPIVDNGMLFNCAVLISSGKILGVIPKTFICNSNEYYEERWFSSDQDRVSEIVVINGVEIPFGANNLFRVKDIGLIVGIEICEDLWSVIPPSSFQALSGANIILNLSASDEYLGKADYRRNLVKIHSSKILAGYVYCSCGPNESSTDVTFANHNILSENGVLLKESKRFSFETIMTIADFDLEKIKNDRLKNNSYANKDSIKSYEIIDFEISDRTLYSLERNISKYPFVPEDFNKRAEICKEIFNIQTAGLLKRIKTIGCKNVVIGISGGLDSTLALLVCYKAFNLAGLEPKGIKTITMPGFGTTERTKNNAEKLAELLGTELITIDIKDAVNQHFKDINHPADQYDIVYENSQARERTQILMDYANKVNGIVVGTGDLSELALGWCTYNGDQMSMYGVNSGVPKTLVKYIIETQALEEFTGEFSEILFDICSTPISPELLPKGKNDEIIQETEKSVGPYVLNDFFLYYFVRMNYSPQKILILAINIFNKEYNNEFIRTTLISFYKRFFTQQFKRSAMPDGIKVGSIALSPRGDWRMPSDASFELWIKEIKKINLELI